MQPMIPHLPSMLNMDMTQVPTVIHTKRLFIGEIRKDAPAERVKELLRELFPTASHIEVYAEVNAEPPRNRGFAFVHYATSDEAAKNREECRRRKPKLLGRVLSCDWAQAENDVPDEIMRTVRVLFVRNVHPRATEEELRRYFGGIERGVTKVKIQKAYAFVHFDSRERAEEVKTNLDGKPFHGCRLEIQWSKPQLHRSRLAPPPLATHHVPTAPYTIPVPNNTRANQIHQMRAPIYASVVFPSLANGSHFLEGYSIYPMEVIPPPAPASTATLPVTPDLQMRPIWQQMLKKLHSVGMTTPIVTTSIFVSSNSMQLFSIFRSTVLFEAGIRVEGEARSSQHDAEDAALCQVLALLEGLPYQQRCINNNLYA